MRSYISTAGTLISGTEHTADKGSALLGIAVPTSSTAAGPDRRPAF
jgi:hypothetical protein